MRFNAMTLVDSRILRGVRVDMSSISVVVVMVMSTTTAPVLRNGLVSDQDRGCESGKWTVGSGEWKVESHSLSGLGWAGLGYE